MAEFLQPRLSDRKLRLIACACCRRVLEFMEDHRSRQAVLVAEQFADGEVGRDELLAAFTAALEARGAVDETYIAPEVAAAYAADPELRTTLHYAVDAAHQTAHENGLS